MDKKIVVRKILTDRNGFGRVDEKVLVEESELRYLMPLDYVLLDYVLFSGKQGADGTFKMGEAPPDVDMSRTERRFRLVRVKQIYVAEYEEV